MRKDIRRFFESGKLLRRMILTYLLRGAEASSEANRFSASQEIPRILWNPKIHYHIHKCLPPVPNLNQLDPMHTPTSHFLKIYLNNPPVYALFSQVVSFPQVSPPKPCIRLSSPPYAIHLILLDLITRTILDEEYRSLSSPLCRFLHSLVTSSLLGSNILNAFILCSSLWATRLYTSAKR